LQSLDVFRGATIAAMILVNNPGDELASYWPLQHSKWNGWTPTDLIFPFFLFIVGVAMAFSFGSRLQQGESRRRLIGHVLWRGLLIFAIGIFLNGFPNRFHLHSLRIYGVLPRIAVCYVITALLELWSDWRTHLGVIVACLVGYWCLMRYVSVPGFGIPTHAIPLLDPDRNMVAWLDRKVLAGHLYEGTRDPEGILSTIPAVATSLLGLLTGKWIRSAGSGLAKTIAMVLAGGLLIFLGEVVNIWFPINKKLWTSSFVLLTAGLSLVCLAVCYWVTDVKRWRGWWTKPFLVFGMNAIAAYICAAVMADILDRLQFFFSGAGVMSSQEVLYERCFRPYANPANASLLYAATFVLICWTATWLLYRRGIFLKI
jgi:predicted acyltransferase